MSKKVNFFIEGLKNLQTIGAFFPTSKHVGMAMAKKLSYHPGQVILELGAGDGVITKQILANMHPDATLLAFEINDKFCQKLRDIDDTRLIVVQDGAENVKLHLEENGLDKVDGIISALPTTNLPKPLVKSILTVCTDVLKSGALFVQINYSVAIKKTYKKYFDTIKISFEAKNMPPAFIFQMSKQVEFY